VNWTPVVYKPETAWLAIQMNSHSVQSPVPAGRKATIVVSRRKTVACVPGAPHSVQIAFAAQKTILLLSTKPLMIVLAKKEKIAAVHGFRSTEMQPALQCFAVPTESTQRQLHGLVINVAWVTSRVRENAGTSRNLLRHAQRRATTQALFVKHLAIHGVERRVVLVVATQILAWDAQFPAVRIRQRFAMPDKETPAVPLMRHVPVSAEKAAEAAGPVQILAEIPAATW